jgi:ATP-dependent Lon protease
MNDVTAPTLPVLPLRAGVVFPGMVVTIALESDEARAAAEAAGDSGRLLLVPVTEAGYARVGVIASVENAGALPNGTEALMVRGEHRARLGSATVAQPAVGAGDALWVEATAIDETAIDDEAADDHEAGPVDAGSRAEAVRVYRAVARGLLERLGGRRFAELLDDVGSAGALADTVGWWPDLSLERKVELLETIDVDDRLRKATSWLKESLADIELTEQIRTEVTDGMEKNQREFLLRQQLAAIKKELGDDADDDVVDELRQRAAELDAPDDVRTALTREIDRLERTSEQSAEHGWIRTWIETVVELPWGQTSDDHLDLADARAVLDADHTGLDEVKARIIEYLAVRKLRRERDMGTSDGRRGGAIVALVGPPGVGKTSLGESVARALGRDFVRVALGGIRDEAEIRGHRRTYVGAQPGRIARALTDAGTMNPVFLLDEIDKVDNDWRGDPSSALLEVLDPAQNHAFRDHYLEVDLDLSDVLFIATANTLDSVPGPLLDRLEVVTLDGYTDDEKVAIARDHLLDRQLERNGLHADEVDVTDDALRDIVRGHTREAGVRQLERQLGKVLRKAATSIAGADEHATDGDGAPPDPVMVDTGDLATYLGRPRFTDEEAGRTPRTGVATGLAVTGAGGDVLFVEAAAMDGEPGLTLTGQLGDVMSESGSIALSYIRSHRDELEIDADPAARRFHVHFPAGAVPKDGPSAGITMTTALVSLLTDTPVRADVGMTGEITLQGKVLPIGGVKQKLLAAHRAGLREVVIPGRNEVDLDDVPEHVLDELVVHPVDDINEVLAIALAA